MLDRRRVPRHRVRWLGKWRFVDQPTADWWHECRLVDVSALGFALELFEELPENLIGRTVAVEVHNPHGSMAICMMGDVRNLSRGSEGATRVGVELAGADTEYAVLRCLEGLQIGAK